VIALAVSVIQTQDTTTVAHTTACVSIPEGAVTIDNNISVDFKRKTIKEVVVSKIFRNYVKNCPK